MTIRPQASELWQRIRAAGTRTLAVMGMTKNTGKTVALNHLLAQAYGDHVAVGLTSIGRDGEERDQVFSVPKPPVLVWPGALVATARDTLARAKVRIKPVAGTGIASPMGEIVLVKALEAGEMEVAGASRSHDQKTVIALLARAGADVVFLDGALGRSQHATPAIADGVVLATGAAIGGGIGDVIRKTRDRLALLGIATADAATAERCAGLFALGGVGLWARDGRPLYQAPIASLNAGETLLARAAADVGTVACSGAVGRSLWRSFETLAGRHPGLTIVVADGTRLFVDAADLAALAARGARVVAHSGIRVAGITLNPTTPLGAPFDAGAFLTQARAALPEHWVTDVRLENTIPMETSDGPVAA